MKTIILAGGLGTRISEETVDKPKPMVLINGKPMLWHIMNIYAKQGFTDFVIATGYLGIVIEEWVAGLDTPWTVTTLDTGIETQTGGRIKKCLERFPNERFFATYGDGVGNINLNKLLEFHNSNRKIATLTAVRPPARFGYLEISGNDVVNFGEKKQSDAGWINGGFFVLEPQVIEFIDSYSEPFETDALPSLSQKKLLSAYKHFGFWQPMDTLREKTDLELLSKSGNPPWMKDL